MKTCLIWDEPAVAAHEGVAFHLNPAVKHPENPVLLPGEPHEWDSLQVTWPATVLYDPAEGKFRCWYSGLDALQVPGRGWQPGYAESEDGIHWVKPALGQVTHRDEPTNRLGPGWDAGLLSFVFDNPSPQAPAAQRFGSYWMEVGRDAQGNPDMSVLGKSLAWSPDGKVWTRAGTAYEALPFDRASLQDISQLVVDETDPDPDYRVKGYAQIGRPRSWDGKPATRQIGLVHGADVTHVVDAPEPIALAPVEGIDEELHFASVKRFGDDFLMLFESDRFSAQPLNGDLRLAVSRDGRSFRRIHPHEPLVATGARGRWDENLLVTTSSAIQDVGAEHWIFYLGCPDVYTRWPGEYAVSWDLRGSLFYPSYMGLATLPRHRFAYAAGPGCFTTHEHGLAQGEVWINAEGAPRLEAQDRAGAVLATGTVSEVTREGVYRQVAWSAPLAGQTVRITLHLDEGTHVFGYQYE